MGEVLAVQFPQTMRALGNTRAHPLSRPYLVRVRRKLTPQENKRLSLEKDRRNSYGENDKASRKNIPRAKARVNRANRRAETVGLSGALGPVDSSAEEAAEQRVVGRRRKVWRKWADEPLGRTLARREGETDFPFDASDRLP